MSAPININILPMAPGSASAQDNSFASNLQRRLPGLEVRVQTDVAKDETKIKVRFKMRTWAPVAGEEEIEDHYIIDQHIMRMGSVEQLAEMYANVIQTRMREAINEKMQPNPEIRALLNVAGFKCRFNSDHGFFQVWRDDAGKNAPSPRTEIDQEAGPEEWRYMLSELVEIARLEREHPTLRISSGRPYNERSQKRAAMSRYDQEKIKFAEPLRYKPVVDPGPNEISPFSRLVDRQTYEENMRRERMLRSMYEHGIPHDEIAKMIR